MILAMGSALEAVLCGLKLDFTPLLLLLAPHQCLFALLDMQSFLKRWRESSWMNEECWWEQMAGWLLFVLSCHFCLPVVAMMIIWWACCFLLRMFHDKKWCVFHIYYGFLPLYFEKRGYYENSKSSKRLLEFSCISIFNITVLLFLRESNKVDNRHEQKKIQNQD